jgi:Fur family ferric uptake transcriptional regulator
VDAQPEATASPRSTRQRRAVEAEMVASADFRSAQEIHHALRRGGEKVGLATVYRTLQALAEGGDVDALTSSGQTVYRRCTDDRHHHHLVCRHCGRTVEITGPTVERWASAIAEEHGFRDVDHTLELFGTCAGCAGR